MEIQTLSPKLFRGWIQELADQIKEKYDEGFSCREVGRQLNINHCRVRNYLSHMGYDFSKAEGCTRSSKTRFDDVELSKKLLEIIEGNLLGDGSLTIQKNTAKPHLIPRSALYAHDTKSLAQIEWLKEILKENGLPIGDYVHHSEACQRTIKSGPNIGSIVNYKEKHGFKSTAQPSLKELREKWYQPDKIIPKDLKLTPTMLLHWYIGDGTLVNNPYGHSTRLYTYGFTYDDCYYLKKRLLFDLDLESSVLKRSGSETQYYIAIQTGQNHSNIFHFFDLIGECPPELIADYGHKWISKS
jgi:hypothetical protein